MVFMKSAAIGLVLLLIAVPGLNLLWRALVNWLVDDDNAVLAAESV